MEERKTDIPNDWYTEWTRRTQRHGRVKNLSDLLVSILKPGEILLSDLLVLILEPAKLIFSALVHLGSCLCGWPCNHYWEDFCRGMHQLLHRVKPKPSHLTTEMPNDVAPPCISSFHDIWQRFVNKY